MNEGLRHGGPKNPEEHEMLKHGRPLHLVIVHNFELDKETGNPKITEDPERFNKLMDQIDQKSEIVKIYAGIPKEGDKQAETTTKTIDTITEAMLGRGKSMRSTMTRRELQRLPGTPEYYSYLASRSREENKELSELEDQEVLKATGDALYDLWRKNPDPEGKINTAEEVTARFEHIIDRLKKVSERSPATWPEATLVLIVDKAIQGWLFKQTGVPSKEMGIIHDDEPIEIDFSGKNDEQPLFTFKGETYSIKLENNMEANNE